MSQKNRHKMTYSLREERPTYLLSFYMRLFSCLLLRDCMHSNTTWQTNVEKSFVKRMVVAEKEKKTPTFMFSLSGSLLAFLTLPFSVHVVACVQSNWQSGLGPCGCLPKRLAQQSRKPTFICKGWGGGHGRQVKNCAGFLIKMYLN